MSSTHKKKQLSKLEKIIGEKKLNVSISRMNNVIITARTLTADVKHQIKGFLESIENVELNIST